MNWVLWFIHPQMQQMENRLRTCDAQKELKALRCKLELVEEEKRDYSDKHSKAEVQVKDLWFTGEDIFESIVGYYSVLYKTETTL